jgi:DNA-binding transcriptional MerR regulator
VLNRKEAKAQSKQGRQQTKAARSYLRTSEVAAAVGVHPNTVRLYEQWGFLPPIPRSPAGYRLFTAHHVDLMRLGRTALRGPWPGRAIRESALAIVRLAAADDLGGALECGYRHLALVRAEQARADAAASLLERWAQGSAVDASEEWLRIGQAAKRLGVTRDMLRNWERNGLLRVPRDPRNGYRRYGAAELGRCRVIRMLRQAGYGMMAILRMMHALDSGQDGNLRHTLDTPRPDEDVYLAADHWLSALADLESRALQVIEQLERMINL